MPMITAQTLGASPAGAKPLKGSVRTGAARRAGEATAAATDDRLARSEPLGLTSTGVGSVGLSGTVGAGGAAVVAGDDDVEVGGSSVATGPALERRWAVCLCPGVQP